MGKLVNMLGEDISEQSPTLYSIRINVPSDKYSIEVVEKIAQQLHVILGDNKIYHEAPTIEGIYDNTPIELNNA